MIDTHCHILPNLDDGPTNFDESIKMAEIASKDGIKGIIATPHVYDGEHTIQDIIKQVDHLNRFLRKSRIPVVIYPGAEVSMSMDPARISTYTLNHTPYILIEFPHDHLPSFAGRILSWLIAKGLKPVIAHPERNYSVIRSPDLLLNLLNDKIHVQVTAGSITGDFGVDIQYCADYLLNSGKVDLIASDAHSAKIRIPILSKAAEVVSRKLGKKVSKRLVTQNPAALIAGMEIH